MLSKQIAKFHLTTVKMSLKLEIEQKKQGLSNKRATSRADDERIQKLYAQKKNAERVLLSLYKFSVHDSYHDLNLTDKQYSCFVGCC